MSIEVLGVELKHLREAVERLLTLAERNPSREEVQAADNALARRVDSLESEGRAKDTRIRALEDERTGLRAILALLGFIGVAGVAAILKWFLAQ